MELKVNISDPKEVAQGLMLLQSLAGAYYAAQTERLKGSEETVKASYPVPESRPAPAAEAVQSDMAERGKAVRAVKPTAPIEAIEAEPAEEAVTDPDAPPRRRGRPPMTPEQRAAKARAKGEPRPATAAEAAAMPVGAVLAGVPARNLVATLEAGDLPEPEIELHTGLADPTPEPEPVAAKPNGTMPFDDPDMISLMEATATPAAPAPVVASLALPDPAPAEQEMISDADLWDIDGKEPEPEPEPAPKADESQYRKMTLSQLDVAWRTMGQARGVHWMRSAIARHNIRSPSDMKAEMLLHVLEHPDEYNPPSV